jgi:hypothetical protein
MPLHIFLGVEVLLYFIVRVEVINIPIWFEFKFGPAGLLPRTTHMA